MNDRTCLGRWSTGLRRWWQSWISRSRRRLGSCWGCFPPVRHRTKHEEIRCHVNKYAARWPSNVNRSNTLILDLNKNNSKLLLRSRYGCDYCDHGFCMFVCTPAYIQNRTTIFHEISCTFPGYVWLAFHFRDPPIPSPVTSSSSNSPLCTSITTSLSLPA